MKRTLFVTGAGISLASGIPTYRGTDPEAVWERNSVDMATRSYFLSSPTGSWKFYLDRFFKYRDCEPNEAHHLLAELDRKTPVGQFLLVTQNVDNLHEKAGSKALIKVHGSIERVRCSRHGCENGGPKGSKVLDTSDPEWAEFIKETIFDNIPRCKICRKFYRPHILWFDEFYSDHETFGYEAVRAYASKAERIVFLGTSMSVGITEMIVRMGSAEAWSKAPPAEMILVDPGLKEAPFGVTLVNTTAQEWLREEVKRG